MVHVMNTHNYVIVGLGLTGLSCARYLASRGCVFSVVDSSEQPPQLGVLTHCFPHVTVHVGGITDDSLSGADELVVSPGVPLSEPAIARAMDAGVSVCGDIDLFCRELATREKPAPMVAITGSNGKSTVTTLVGEMVHAAGKKVAVGGNIGVPALDLLHDAEPDYYVLELSSFQLERNEAIHAQVATMLNISSDHMDRYASFDCYYQAKQRIFRGCQQAVVNRDDPLSMPLDTKAINLWFFSAHLTKLNTLNARSFGIVEQDGEEYFAYAEKPLMPTAQLKMVGRHNVANSLAALALTHAIGIPLQSSLKVLRRFPGLPHRCQWVGEIDGVSFYNDSKGTNVGAVIATVKGLHESRQGRLGKIVWIAGGQSKQADFSPLLPLIRQHCRAVVLMGEAAEELSALIGTMLPKQYAISMDEAVAQAYSMAKSHDKVLLSPACASFDQFAHYQQRGEVYRQAVERLLTSDRL